MRYLLDPLPYALVHAQVKHRWTVGGIRVRNIVLELPPAPAALVLVGLAFVILSALSTAAFLLMAVLGPPSDGYCPLLTPAEAGGDEGEDARGEDWKSVSPD